MTQELPEGTVAVLFSDVVGSTDLTTRRGDDAAQEILRGQRDLTRQKVEEHSGQTGARPSDVPGDRDKARDLLTEAVAMYRQIGMPKHVGMAEALLGEV